MRPPLFFTARQILTAVVTLFAFIWVSAQQAVTVNPVLTPPFSPYLESYLDKAVISVTNNTNSQQRVKLTGSIEGDNGIFVRTEDDWRPGEPIILLPFQTKTVFVSKRSENFLDPQNVETNISQAQQVNIGRTGILPEGVYTFCVQAMDYDNGNQLSAPEPQGCMPIVISYPEPPILTGPVCETEVITNTPVFTWMPPVGNLAGAALRYNLYLVKLLPGQDPNDVMIMAANYGAGNVFTVSGLQTNSYVYKPSDPPLQNNETYVWMVKAYDQNNKIVFQNDGKSEICTFLKKYIKGNPNPPGAVAEVPEENAGEEEEGDTPPAPYEGACASDCLFPEEGLGGFVLDSAQFVVAPDTIIKIGTFDMRVLSLDPADPLHPGKISGHGLIQVPFVNTERLRVRVHFDTLVLNTAMQVLSGTARAKVQPGAATMLPQYDNTAWDGFSTEGANLFALDTWIKGQIDSAKNEVFTAWNTYGFEMPMGVSRGGHSLAVTKMDFHPRYATFCAITVVNLPSFTQNVTPIALGVGGMCITKDDICQEGKLFLAQNFTADLTPGAQGNELTLIASTPEPLDTIGTFMTFDTSGIDLVHIQAELTMPQNKIVRVDSTGAFLGIAKAYLTARADSLTDWVLKASMDMFQIAGAPDYTFLPGDMYIDLSNASNPPPPLDSITYFELASDPTWKGLFCQQMAVRMKTPLNESANPTWIIINDLFIDTSGVSVNITGKNLISLGNGAIGSFNFSLSDFKLLIQHNSFVYGRMDGAMLLNFQDRPGGIMNIFTAQGNSSVIPYHALITQMPSIDSLNGPKQLKYEFLMRPIDTIEVPIWLATMMLDSTSRIDINNHNGSFTGSALLTGSLGIHSQIPLVGTTAFTGITFQNFGLISNDPYFSMGGVNFSLASPQHSIAGFPVSLNDVNFVMDEHSHPGLQFDMGLNLSDVSGMLPSATTKFSLFGKIEMVGGDVTPAFAHARLDEICLDGNLSVVHIKGCVSFFNGHQVFGDGFRGNLEVKFPPEITVQASMQFGNVNNYNYWYADALAILPTGVPLFAGLEAFGFGGGAYYHMKRSAQLPTMNMNSSPNQNGNGQPGYSMSGIQYVPDKSIAIGIKAKVYFGTVQRDVFNGDVALEVTVTSQGSLGSIYLDGNARFVSDDEMEKGTVTGTLKAYYDNEKKIFSTTVNAKLDLTIVEATGTLEAYFDGGNGPLKWYVRFGRPVDSNWVNLTFAKFYNVETYFQVGNFDIDPMPAPPAFINDIVKGGFEKSASERSGVQGNDFAIIHGGRSGFNYDGKFLIFYAKLDAGFGYDLSLKKVTTGCGGVGNPNDVGLNGWYASGQAYVGARGEIGIEADLGFVSGQFTIASVGAAAIIQGGFVNPTWVKGALAGYYELFDGVIRGNYKYEFAVGNECKPADVDPLTKMKIISDVAPAHNTYNVEVTSVPAVATMLKMDINSHIYAQQKDGQGVVKHRLFRFHSGLLNIEMTKNGAVQDLSAWKKVPSNDNFGMRWEPDMTLDKLSTYSMKIVAQMEECSAVSYNAQTKYASCTGSWAPAKLNGQVFKETRTSNFKTNAGLDKIPESLVEYTIPYQQARTVLPEELDNLTLKMTTGFNPNSYKLGPAGAQLAFRARLVKLSGEGNVSSTAINMSAGVSAVKFQWPSTPDASSFYAIQIVALWKMPAQAQQQNTSFVIRDSIQRFYSGSNLSYATVTNSKLNQNQLTLPENSTLLYEIRFRTSRYKNLTEKLVALDASQISYNVRPKSGGDMKKITLSGAEITSPAATKNAINSKVGNPAGTIPTIGWIPSMWLLGPEMFDAYDMTGYTKVMPNKTVSLPALVRFENQDLADFEKMIMHSTLDTLLKHSAAKLDISRLVPGGGSFDYEVGGPSSSKIGWDDYKNGTYVEPVPWVHYYQNIPFNISMSGISNIVGSTGIFGSSGSIGTLGTMNTGSQRRRPWWMPEMSLGSPGIIQFTSTYDNSWDIPVVINPNIILEGIEGRINWPTFPGFGVYKGYLEGLGFAYDNVKTRWSAIGNIGAGSPRVTSPAGNIYNFQQVYTGGTQNRTGKK